MVRVLMLACLLGGVMMTREVMAQQVACGAVSARWLHINADQTLVVTPAALPHTKKRFLNLVTIFGATRTGKSTLLNILAQREVFATAAGDVPCTSGAHVSPVLRAEFDDSPDVDVAFVDVEGQGDLDPSYDIKLVSPLVLASRVMIFNILGAPNRHRALQLLGTLNEAASRLDGKKNSTKGARCGHLLIVVQNRNPSETDSMRSRLLELEDGPEAGFKERNDIRTALTKNFESIRVHPLPVPVTDAMELQSGLVHSTTFEASYLKASAELRSHVLAAVKTPKQVDGTAHLSRELMEGLVDNFVGAVNRGDVDDLVERSMRMLATQTVEKLLTRYDVLFEKLLRQLPIDDVSVNETVSKETEICNGVIETLFTGLTANESRTEIEEAKRPMLIAFTAMNNVSRLAVDDFRKALHAAVLPLSPDELAVKVTLANTTAGRQMKQYLTEAEAQIGEVHPLIISASRRGVLPSCSSVRQTINDALTPKLEQIVADFGLMNSVLTAQIRDFDSRVTKLLAGSLPVQNLEALLSSYISDRSDIIRKGLAGTSLESDAISRLKVAVESVSSALRDMNNAAARVLKKMDRDLSTLWSKQTPASLFEDMPQGAGDQVRDVAIALAETELQESLRDVPHPAELVAKRSGKQGHWNTASYVKTKLDAQLRSMANDFVMRKGRERTEFVDANRKLAGLVFTMLIIVAIIWFITEMEGWEAVMTCVGVLVAGAVGIALFCAAVAIFIQVFPFLIAIMVLCAGGQVVHTGPRGGRYTISRNGNRVYR